MWDDLTKNAFRIFKRVIAMTSSMQWPIFSYTISVWEKSLKRFKKKGEDMSYTLNDFIV